MRLTLRILKPFSFLPALLMMCLIFRFSAQTGEDSGSLSYQVSYQIVRIGNILLNKGMDDRQMEDCAHRIEYPVRKLAHYSEYFLLAVTVAFPFYIYGLRGVRLFLTTGLICVAFAAGDEYHQSFVEARGPSVKDVGIDSLGVLTELLFMKAVFWLFDDFRAS